MPLKVLKAMFFIGGLVITSTINTIIAAFLVWLVRHWVTIPELWPFMILCGVMGFFTGWFFLGRYMVWISNSLDDAHRRRLQRERHVPDDLPPM